MAEGLLKSKVSGEVDDWRIESAGTWTINGEPAALNARIAMQEMGIEIDDHRSRIINPGIIDEFSLIITMERGHKEALRIEFPQVASRVYLLSEMVGKSFDIVDPIGGPLVDFQTTAREIDQLLSQGFNRIEELSRDSDTGL
jgi:protein-tyrosine-phosphatase